jgi:hypothetical protein
MALRLLLATARSNVFWQALYVSRRLPIHPAANIPMRNHHWWNRATESIPGGVSSPLRAFKSVGGVLRFITRADGAIVGSDYQRREGQEYGRPRVLCLLRTAAVLDRPARKLPDNGDCCHRKDRNPTPLIPISPN